MVGILESYFVGSTNAAHSVGGAALAAKDKAHNVFGYMQYHTRRAPDDARKMYHANGHGKL